MNGVKRCLKIIADSSRCTLRSRCFFTRSNSWVGLYCGIASSAHRSPSFTACVSPASRGFPLAIQYLNVTQESKARKIRKAIPDELWIILFVGIGGVCVFLASEYNKHKLGKKRPPELEIKLKRAKKKEIEGQKEESVTMLKEALLLIHKYLQANPEPLEDNEQDVGKIRTHKYLRYTLDQLANLSFELEKWKEAEHYFRLLLRDLLSKGTLKDDDSVIEVSLKLSIVCAHQNKHDLALEGFKWSTKTIQDKVNKSDEVSEDSKALLGVCLESWGAYLLSQDKPSQAAELLSKALKVSKEVLGEDHEQTTVILNNLAKAYAESGRYELAEDLAREAVRIAEKTENSSHNARFVANLGAILNLKGNFLKAKEALQKALKMADETQDQETKDMVNDSLTKLDAKTSPSLP